MRPFVRSAFALACAASFATAAQAQQSTTLKMQATWPASLTLYENFTYFADRINKVSGGSLKIDAMPAGQVVPAFEVLDATQRKCSTARTLGRATGSARARLRSSSPAARAAPSAWT